MSLCFQNIFSGYGLVSSLFLAGITSGFTHCAGMCGPFVLAQTTQISPHTSLLKRLAGGALLYYHLGRITTYVSLAIIFSTFLNTALLFSQAKNVVSALILFSAAFIFLVNIVPALGSVFPYLARIRLPISQTVLTRMARPLMASQTGLSRYGLGVLLGFMPCGMVMASLMAAAAAGTPIQSGIAMASFAVGTVPALILTATGGQMLQTLFPKTIPVLKLIMILISAGTLLATSGQMILS